MLINVTVVTTASFPVGMNMRETTISHTLLHNRFMDSTGCRLEKNGIVLIDPEKALSKKEIVNSCPHRVIFWNEEKNIPQKCTLCAHLLEEGYKQPRCAEACPTGALTFGDLDDPRWSTWVYPRGLLPGRWS
jgi:ferredoxin